MLARAIACSVHGLAGVPVVVEADIANGLPNFTIVGLTDRAIQEARERVRASVRNAGFEFPSRRLTVNLAPAEVPKEGTGFDLGIAMAILCLGNSSLRIDGYGFIGELALDGSVRPVTGVLPMARCLRAAGVRHLAVAEENAAEAALVDSLAVIGVSSLQRCVAHLDGTDPLPAANAGSAPAAEEAADLADVRGQGQAKRALEIAAAGGHNLLMMGPPGSGKTMLARAFCSLLPDLDNEESLEVAALYSLRGALRERPPTATRPPFRAPHHSVSRAGLVGGGSGLARPGEISLAHHGSTTLSHEGDGVARAALIAPPSPGLSICSMSRGPGPATATSGRRIRVGWLDGLNSGDGTRRLRGMTLCPACGHEDRAGARFCSECGAAMAAIAAAPREERKVVTVLFADLVGFTSRSEQLDPEDVRAFLSPYYARLRTELERFGGTVEKFIGDAVMALFGAPVAHEDDPERAVRAALAIRDWVMEQEAGLQLRIAVNTGEALVALGAQPTQGEGMASGDVVNTTARLQTAAPVNGILVGETTYRATSQVITYRAAEPVTAKGKTEPVPAWEALEARSRFGVDLASAKRSPLVGRTHELGVLADALARVRRERSPQLMTIVGVPGIGKSRLVAELFLVVADDPSELIYWRQGRSLPYGDGITFWALGEMVKAQAGILETDPPDEAEQKLRVSVAEIIPAVADAQWIEGHLRPLAGLSSDSEARGDRREEAFTAWRRFFEALAEKAPLVLVFEDLHWADDNLLEFVEHLIDWASGVPMLIVCNARPELFERHPGWGGSTRNATRLSLSPLSDEETAQLLSGLSDRPVMVAETQQALLARAGGNPLYAEQYVRMLAERGDADELPLPETVQGIIAARLDALPADEKSLLQSAAVMGKVFWLGAVALAGDLDRRTAELLLHSLERKDFLQRARRSSVADEAEYAFLHVLVRDVAYGQIPRVRRAEQHRLASEWVGSLGRSEDHAEMLAHHYLSALELWRATSQPIDPAVAERALASLSGAGDRASSLNAYTSAAAFYQSALELAPTGSLERARLLFQLGRTRLIGGDLDPGLLTAACAELVAAGDRETAAEAEAALAFVYSDRGDTDRSAEHFGRARELVDNVKPSRAKASVIRSIAGRLMLSGKSGEAIRLGQESLAMAEELGLDELRAHALINIGVSKMNIGDPGAIEDLEQGLAIALNANVPAAICRAQLNLSAAVLYSGEVEQSAAFVHAAAATASRFGLVGEQRFIRGAQAEVAFAGGHWDEALVAVEEFLAEVEAGSPQYEAPICYNWRAQIRLGRDDDVGALADAEHAIDLARLVKDPQILFPTLAGCAHLLRENGETKRASTLADEFLAELKAGRSEPSAMVAVHVLAWTLAALRRGQELIEVLAGSDVPWVRAARAFAEGDLRRAADICAEMGAATEEARDRLWLAEALIELNRRFEADVELQRALAFYHSVGATRYIRECEALLVKSA